MNYLSAEEARKVALNCKLSETTIDFKKYMVEINRAASKGHRTACIQAWVDVAACDIVALEKLGYWVDVKSTERPFKTIVVRW